MAPSGHTWDVALPGSRGRAWWYTGSQMEREHSCHTRCNASGCIGNSHAQHDWRHVRRGGGMASGRRKLECRRFGRGRDTHSWAFAGGSWSAAARFWWGQAPMRPCASAPALHRSPPAARHPHEACSPATTMWEKS